MTGFFESIGNIFRPPAPTNYARDVTSSTPGTSSFVGPMPATPSAPSTPSGGGGGGGAGPTNWLPLPGGWMPTVPGTTPGSFGGGGVLPASAFPGGSGTTQAQIAGGATQVQIVGGTTPVQAAINPSAISQSQLNELLSQGIDVFNPRVLQALNRQERINKQLQGKTEQTPTTAPERATFSEKQTSTYKGVPVYTAYITEGGVTRLATAADYSKYGITRQDLFPSTETAGKPATFAFQRTQPYQDIKYNIEKVGGNIAEAYTKAETIGAKILPALPEPTAKNLSEGDLMVFHAIKGAYEDIREHPIKNVAEYAAFAGAGKLLGLGKEFITADILPAIKNAIPESVILSKGFGGVSAANLEKGTADLSLLARPAGVSTGKVINLGVGAGLIGVSVYNDISSSTSAQEAAGNIGVTLKDIVIGGAGFSKGYESMTKPIITKEIPQQVSVKYSEVRIPVIKGEELKVFDKLLIEQNIIPRQVEISTRARQILKSEPIKELSPISKPYTTRVITPSTFISEKPYSAFEFGRRGIKISSISGKGEVIDLREIEGTKVDKRLIQDLAIGERYAVTEKGFKELKKLDKDISIKDIFANLPKESTYQTGVVSREELAKLKLSNDFNTENLLKGIKKVREKVVKGVPIGTTEQQFKYLGKFDEVITSESAKFDITKGEIVFKEISKAYPKSFGAVQRMKGITYTLKEPIVLPEEKMGIKITDIKENEVKANLPKQKTYWTDKKIKQQLKEMSKIKTIPVPPRIKSVVVSKATREILEAKSIKKVLPVQISGIKTKQENFARQFSVLKNSDKQMNKYSNLTKLIPSQKTISSERLVEKMNEKQIERNAAVEKNIEKQMERLQEKQIQKLSPRLVERTTERTILGRYAILRDLNISPKKETPQLKTKQDLLRRRKFLKGYDLFIRRHGKFVEEAAGLTRESALSLGTKKVIQDLSATFTLRPSRESGKDLNIPDYFQKYKRALRAPTPKSKLRKYGEVFIQRETSVPEIGTTGRLTSRGEKREILSAKLKKERMEKYLR